MEDPTGHYKYTRPFAGYQMNVERTAARPVRLATYSSVTVASVLIVTKLGARLATETVSFLASLVDSLLDVGATLVNLFAVRHALQPADQEHRFGHEKGQKLWLGSPKPLLLRTAASF